MKKKDSFSQFIVQIKRNTMLLRIIKKKICSISSNKDEKKNGSTENANDFMCAEKFMNVFDAAQDFNFVTTIFR